MNQQEAIKVIAILLQADDFCTSCARGLLLEFVTEWPEHETLADEAFRKHFESEEWIRI